MTVHAVALIIKRNTHVKANFITSAAKRTVPEDLITSQTRHKSSNTVKMYIRRGKNFEETAAGMVGL